MEKIVFFFLLLFVNFISIRATEKTPDPFVKLKINGTEYKNGDKINLRAGDKVSLEVKVYGGRRAWCMEPNKYANIGKNTRIESNDETGLVFTTGPEFRGIWKIQSEKASWYGQLNDYIVATADKNSAELSVPKKTGSYILTAKAIAVWHYDRYSQGNHVESTEENKAEATFTVIVEIGEDVWFSSPNITASGDKDDDIKFRLETIQERYNTISKQMLDGKFDLAKSNIEGLKDNLSTIKVRLDALKKEKKSFNCAITFIGLPSDKAMKKLNALKKLFDDWKTMFKISSNNAQEINKILLNKQMVFSNNILKSVIKNYIDWGSGIPGPNDFFGAMPVNLALTIPSSVMDWYGNAQEDASILKDQVLAIKKLTELREFYLNRSSEYVKEDKKIKTEIDKNKPVEDLASQFKGIFAGIGWGKWKNSN